MIKLFSLDAISKSASAFNTDKLLWLNNHYMRSLDPAYVAKHLAWHMEHQQIDTSNGPALADVVTLLAERCNTLVEVAAQSRYLFEEYEAIDEAAAKKHLRGVAAEPLALAKTKLAALETWTTEALHELIEATAAELGRGMGKVGMPLRARHRSGPVSCYRRRDGAGGQGAGPRPHRPRPGVYRSAHGRRVSLPPHIAVTGLG